MTTITRRILASLILTLVWGFTADSALASPLDDAKAAGLVGEKADGYVGAVTGDASVRLLIDQINQGRQAKYAEIADQRGAPIDAVAAIAGKKLIDRTPNGQFVMGGDGKWRKR